MAMLAILLTSMFTMISVPAVQSSVQNPLFKITMIAPGNANLLRRQWALIIQNSFESVGIDARVVFLGSDVMYARALTPPASMVGKTYDEGGFDALFIGWTPSAPNVGFGGSYQIYYSKNLPPSGSNYMLWNNSQSDYYLGLMMTEGYTAAGIQAYQNWEAVQYNEVPGSQIMYTTAILSTAQNVNLNGYAWQWGNTGPVPQFASNVTSIALACTGQPLNVLPALSNWWYDTLVYAPIYDGLYYLDANNNIVPGLAVAAPTVTNNNSSFIYTLRDANFSDGVPVTADDVLFSWLAYLNAADGSQLATYLAGYIGDDVTFNWLNGTSTRLVLNLADSTTYYPALPNETSATVNGAAGIGVGIITAIDEHTVNVTIPNFPGLGAPAAIFHPEGEVPYIMPMHILDQIPFSDYATSAFDTMTGSFTVNVNGANETITGPVGSGPYQFVSYNPTTQLITLQKFNGYWNATNLESAGLFGVQNYYVRYITDKDGAVAALKNGEVQVLDPNYQLQLDFAAGNLNFANNYQLPGSGIQQLGYNNRSPIWGTGTATPLGQSDPSKAAEAARDVRVAFDYLIPRQLIINSLESGIGIAAAVHVNPVCPYNNQSIVARDYNPTLAKQYLEMAGYTVAGGVTPPPTPPISTTTGSLVAFTGAFTIDPTVASQQDGMIVVLQNSTDGNTWQSIATGNTNPQGNFYMTYYVPSSTPAQYYRVVQTGIGVHTAAANNLTQTQLFNFNTLNTKYFSLPTDILPTSPITNIFPIDSYVAPYVSQINTQSAQISSMNSTIAAQSAQISTLNSSLNNATNIGYAGVGIAIIALIAAVVLGMRKK